MTPTQETYSDTALAALLGDASGHQERPSPVGLMAAHGGTEAIARIASAICRANEESLSVSLLPLTEESDGISALVATDALVTMADVERDAAPIAQAHLRSLFRNHSLASLRFFAAVPVVGSETDSDPLARIGSLFLGDARTPRTLDAPQRNALMALGRQIGALMALETHKRRLESEAVRLAALATTDGLTGLANRRSFSDRLQAAVTYARQTETSLSLLLMDVDRFKSYNDVYGHPAGDEVLRQVGRILMRTARASDIPARYGGEEFAVLLPETDGETAAIIGDIFRAAIEGHSWSQREVTASFGVAELKVTMQGGSELIAAADAALYRSKANGRNQVTLAE